MEAEANSRPPFELVVRSDVVGVVVGVGRVASQRHLGHVGCAPSPRESGLRGDTILLRRIEHRRVMPRKQIA
jgi:hypothetical protein